jgi:hypothetical protein
MSSIRFEWIPDGSDLQSFLEPYTLTEQTTIEIANVEPGRAYRIEDLLPFQADGETPLASGILSHNDFASYMYWPVSNLHEDPYDRDTMVSNIDFAIHHTRLSPTRHAIRVHTYPPSAPLRGVFPEDNIRFGLFLESNIDTDFSINTTLAGGNVVDFDTHFDFMELGSVYRFDHSDHNAAFPIRAIRESNLETLAEPDELGILTIHLTDPALVGDRVLIQQGNDINDIRMTSTVRDGSVRRLFKEFPAIPFGELFGDGFQTHVLEFPYVDSTYERYDVFLRMRNANGRFITSHAFAHTVELARSYPRPTEIQIESVTKTEPDNTIYFEYPRGYYVGLRFRVREVSLRDMYQHILYSGT